MKYVLFFSEAGQQDLNEIGVKGANLAFLFKRGFKVPPGFIISSKLFNELIQDRRGDIKKKVKELDFPESVKEEIEEAYLSLSVDIESDANSLLETREEFVAVRSSYIEERGNVPQLSQKTILNVKGRERLFSAIRDCYADYFDDDNVTFREENDIEVNPPAIVIQRMVNSKKSGTAYSLNPETGEEEIIVKACFGLGEGLVSGNVFPDTYTVDRKTLTVKDVNIAEKKYAYIRDIETEETAKHKLGNKSVKQVLYDPDIVEIARQVKKLVNTIGAEQKVEWAMRGTNLYVLQTKNLVIEGREPEAVEIEVYDEEKEEEPEIIDISEDSFEEDLVALDEIEKYEDTIDEPEEASESDTMEKTNISDEEDTEKEDMEEEPEYTFGRVGMTETVEEEPIEQEKEEKIEDESIFSSYKELEKPTGINKYSDLAKLNAGNIVVYCHLALKEKMRQRLKKYVREMPDDFEKLLNELLEYESVQYEEEIKKLNQVRDNFINNLRYPEPEEVSLALELISEM